MSIFWSIINGLNNMLSNSLTGGTTSSDDPKSFNHIEELEQQWLKYLYNCTDEQIDRYLDRYGLYYSVEGYGRYKCEKIVAEYCAKNEISIYYI